MELEFIGGKKIWPDWAVSILEGLRREKKLQSYLKLYETYRTRAMNLKKGCATKEQRWKAREAKLKQVQRREL